MFFCSVPFNCEKPIENRFFLGHSYVVYGPLVNGGTTLLFESTPTYPDPGRYWETVERLKIQHFYGSPTALRLLIRQETTPMGIRIIKTRISFALTRKIILVKI